MPISMLMSVLFVHAACPCFISMLHVLAACSCRMPVLHAYAELLAKVKTSVPHSGSGVAPMSSLSGVELLGFWEFGMGGLMGEGRGK
jgi:hypothetical protein